MPRALVGLSFIALAFAGCGRSELLTAAPCASEGAALACGNICGDGSVTCRNGYWSACEVPKATRACQNACGDGTETCRDGAWGSCEVPLGRRSCRGTCGEGAETCSDGAWGRCEVPPVDLPCTNSCGDGLQHCEDERLGYCQVPVVTRDCASACGPGHEACIDGAWQACDAPQPKPPVLHSVIRDFQAFANGDFERNLHGQPGDDPYIVGPLLGADETPVYTNDPRIHTVTSAYSFYQWYHDTPENIRIDYDIQLANAPDKPGFFVYDNPAFFPIDNLGWGNDGNPHNYHFTLAAKLTFRYSGGEVFSFRGDDDMWAFVNDHLAINLGGLHTPESASVSLDEHAAEFEIVRGTIYPIHVFFAERHTVDSNFKLETSVADQGSCQ